MRPKTKFNAKIQKQNSKRKIDFKTKTKDPKEEKTKLKKYIIQSEMQKSQKENNS